jgi:putative Mg2+ transporter-C (MgtC) family protein
MISLSFGPLVSLVASLLLGCVLGFERTLAGKKAGVRTYGLVSMGSCLFILISHFVIPTAEGFAFDPMRMAAAIVMGIGFLCGGVIVFKEQTLQGLTTAAGLWVAAGIGMAVGYGLIDLAVYATISTLVTFTVFWYIEHKLTGAK